MRIGEIDRVTRDDYTLERLPWTKVIYPIDEVLGLWEEVKKSNDMRKKKRHSVGWKAETCSQKAAILWRIILAAAMSIILLKWSTPETGRIRGYEIGKSNGTERSSCQIRVTFLAIGHNRHFMLWRYHRKVDTVWSTAIFHTNCDSASCDGLDEIPPHSSLSFFHQSSRAMSNTLHCLTENYNDRHLDAFVFTVQEKWKD